MFTPEFSFRWCPFWQEYHREVSVCPEYIASGDTWCLAASFLEMIALTTWLRTCLPPLSAAEFLFLP